MRIFYDLQECCADLQLGFVETVKILALESSGNDTI